MSEIRKQCSKCPWKVSTDPYEIPNGYSEDKHRDLERTICHDPTGSIAQRELRIMACHETHNDPCVGWLANQLGPGNSLALRLRAIAGEIEEFELDGEQHEAFEDTLPS